MSRTVITRLLLLALFGAPSALTGQSHTFVPFAIDASSFPDLALDFYLLDSNGTISRDVRAPDLRLTERGSLRKLKTIQCPQKSTPERLSSVLALDMSGSMFNHGNLTMAVAASRAWIDLLPLGYSECAIVGYNHESILLSDFSTNRQRLLDALVRLDATGGTDYDAGLIAEPYGALSLARDRDNKRVVLFLTDGMSGVSTEAVVDLAEQTNASVYVVVLQMDAPESLKEIAERTGAAWFDNVSSIDEAKGIFRSILHRSSGREPCRIEWESDARCIDEIDVTLTSRYHGIEWNGAYTIPATQFPHLERSAFSVSFGRVSPGDVSDTTLVYTARNGPIRIADIFVSPGVFSLGSIPDLPLELQPGQSISIDLLFAPVDSSFRTGYVSVESDACRDHRLFVSGGWPGIRSDSSALYVIQPDGGEVLVAGGQHELEWEGTGVRDRVRLEYSVDNGASWIRITDSAFGTSYSWALPDTVSERCLLRARQMSTDGDDGVVRIDSDERLFAGAFSPDGLFVAAGGQDVHVYTAVDGARQTLPGNLYRTIYSLEFSASGEELLIGSGNETAELFDWQTGETDRQYGTTVTPSAAAFSPDQTWIAAPSFGGRVVRFDAQTGDELQTYDGHTITGFTVDVHPSGNEFVTGANDRDAIVWDVAGGNAIRRLVHGSWVNSVEYSPSGNLLATASHDGNVRIWRRSDFQLLHEFRDSVPGADVAFHPAGDRIAIARFGPDVEVRDVSTGALTRQLVGHERSVNDVEFSRDGSRILTVSWDSTARIWDLSRVPDQVDQSDSVWAIVRPSIVVRDVDMGDVPVGERKDSTVQSCICNIGTYGLELQNIRSLLGRDFSVRSVPMPHRIEPGECIDLDITFAPVATGSATDTLVAAGSGSGHHQSQLTGRGTSVPVELLVPAIDFGTVPLGQRRDTTSALIHNRSASPVTILDLRMVGPDDEQFALDPSSAVRTLEPGDTLVHAVSFAPVRSGATFGRARATVTWGDETNPDTTTMFVQCRGEGECPGSNSDGVLAIPDILEANAGDVVDVALTNANGVVNRPVGSYSYSGVLAFDRTTLAPVESGGDDVLGRDERYSRFSGRWDGVSDTIGTVRLRAALGAVDTSSIRLVYFSFADDCQGFDRLDSGAFALLDLCRAGGTRRFRAGDSVFMRPVSPNPVSGRTTVQFSLAGEDFVDVALYSSAGRRVSTLLRDWLQAGERTLEFDAESVPSGRYVILLETSTRQLVEQIVVSH